MLLKFPFLEKCGYYRSCKQKDTYNYAIPIIEKPQMHTKDFGAFINQWRKFRSRIILLCATNYSQGNSVIHFHFWLLDKIVATMVQKHQATTWVFSRTWQCHKCHSCGISFESQKKKSGHGCEEKLRPSIMWHGHSPCRASHGGKASVEKETSR